MRYQVPQFIEVEDKIVGPFTIKQFVYIVGGLGMSFLLYRFLPGGIVVSLIPIIIIEVLSLALAFYKINNKPFIDFLESAFMFYTKDNLYIWKKENKPIQEISVEKEARQVYVPRLSDSKLKDLTWSLDVNQNSNKSESEE